MGSGFGPKHYIRIVVDFSNRRRFEADRSHILEDLLDLRTEGYQDLGPANIYFYQKHRFSSV